jgi:biopolymer transport protein ExbD
MNRNDSEAVLHLHRTFLPRRQTGRGFLTGTVFLDAALLLVSFVLAESHFVLKPGILIDLPVTSQTESIQFNDMVLSISREGLFFFNDEQVQPSALEAVLRAAVQERPGIALILEADAVTPQSSIAAIYDAAALAGFRQVFIATRSPAAATTPVPAAP